MADITLADFRARFSEFSGLADARASELITEAYTLSDVTRDATMYCIAHLAALEAELTGALDGGSGVVKSEWLGPQRVTYETQAANEREVFFATTAYGRRVLALEGRTPKGTISVVTA